MNAGDNTGFLTHCAQINGKRTIIANVAAATGDNHFCQCLCRKQFGYFCNLQFGFDMLGNLYEAGNLTCKYSGNGTHRFLINLPACAYCLNYLNCELPFSRFFVLTNMPQNYNMFFNGSKVLNLVHYKTIF